MWHANYHIRHSSYVEGGREGGRDMGRGEGIGKNKDEGRARGIRRKEEGKGGRKRDQREAR